MGDRPRKIGGTDIACLFGLNRYGRGPCAVYERIVEGKDTPSNQKMGRGIREEPRIRQLFVERTGLVLEPHPGIIESPRYEFAAVSPDDFAHDGEPLTLEYKSVSVWSAKSWGDDSSDALPEDYAMQLHWAMAITGRPAGRLFAAFGEDLDDGRVFDIKFTRLYFLRRDPAIEAALLRRAAWFWNAHILKRVKPPPDPKPVKAKKKETA